MSAWTDARDNIKDGFVNAWESMTPTARAFLIGVAFGLILGAIGAGMLLC